MTPEWVWGVHAVTAVLRRRAQDVQALQVTERAGLEALMARAGMAGVSVQTVGRSALDARLPGCNHQGVAALCRPAQPLPESALADLLADAEPPPLLLVLDGVTDPHNLGACLRTAEAAGVTAVVAPKDRAAGLTPVVRKVSCGASERLPLVQVTNLARCLRQLQQSGLWIAGAAGEAESSLYERDLRGPLALVMGAEGHGLRRLTRETCDFLLAIPMQGETGSLNVSVATGVLLFEVLRQRRSGSG